MELNIGTAMLLYFSGVITYAFALRIFKIYTKSLFYKLVYINSLCILKFADNLSQDLINGCPEPLGDKENVTKAFDHWRLLALYSLRSCIPDNVWRGMGTLEWKEAMRLLKTIQKENEEKNEIR